MQVIRIEEHGTEQSKSLCDLSYRDGYLVLANAETRAEMLRLPAGQVQYKVGGNSDRLVFLVTPLLGTTTVYFELNSEARKEIESHPEWASRMKEPLSKHNGRFRGTIVATAVLIAIIAAFIVLRKPIFGAMAEMIPFRAEKSIGDQLFNPKMTPEQIKALDQFKPMLDRLKFDEKVWPHGFTFHISSATEPNAYATIGGHIFINKGLINALDRTEDLLGVVAHEMIHVQKRHVARSTVQALGMYFVLSVLLGDVTGLAAVLVENGAPLLNLQYSRGMEEEADHLAVDLMIQNKVDPLGLARSLRVIQDEQKKLIRQSPGGEMMEKLSKIEILSSHPDIDGRIESINNKAKSKLGDTVIEPIPFDYTAWKAVIKDAY